MKEKVVTAPVLIVDATPNIFCSKITV